MRRMPRLASSTHSLSKPIVYLGAVIGVVLLTAWPALHILHIIASTGANNVSNDYTFWVPIVNEVFTGTYAWGQIFRDSLRAGHSFLLPLPVHLLVARWTYWNIYIELYIGWLLFVLRLWLFHAALTHGRPRNWLWWALWPVLSALTFSVSQISVLTFGDTALQMGFSGCGLALGVWGLRRWPGRWPGAGLAALGGLLATWSWGNGPVLWLLFLPGLGWAGFRSRRIYLLWFITAALSLAPHFYYGVVSPTPGALGYASGGSLAQALNFLNRLVSIDAQKLINGLGRPFANGLGTDFGSLPMAEWMGAAGLSLAVFGVVCVWRQRLPARQLTPALASLMYGFLGMWLTTVLRDGIAPWYTTQAMAFWIGLAGLAYIVADTKSATARFHWPSRLWGLSVMGLMGVGYLLSNLHYEDKVFHLSSRSPASAACLRHYRTAPTYCEQYLFQWGLGRAGPLEEFARPLERHHLSVFAPHQTWALQGDFVLDTVQLWETPTGGDSFWSEDLNATPTPFAHYKHLNLFLPTPNAIDWTVTLPPNATRLTFNSAIALSLASPEVGDVNFEILILRPDATISDTHRWALPEDHPQRWQPIQLSLDHYAGQTITLRLTSRTASGVSAWALYRYPTLTVDLDPLRSMDLASHTQPANTDLFPARPVFTPQDFLFNVTDLVPEQAAHLAAATRAEGDWGGLTEPLLVTATPIDLCLANYSHVAVRLAAAPAGNPRYFQLYFRFDGEVDFSEAHSVQIPLLADGESHVYTYPLKLLELARSTRLTGLSLQPVPGTAAPDLNSVWLEEARLIRTDSPVTECTAP